MAGLPDIDGDSFGDFAIGAFSATVTGDPRVGRVFVYSGRTHQVIRVLASPQVRSGFSFGVAVAALPDVNTDGRGDVLVGEIGQTLHTTGFAYLFSGQTFETLHTVVAQQPSVGADYGAPVAAVPDVDGDGVTDFAVSAPEDSPPASSGRVYLYSGATGQLLRTFVSPQAVESSWFGSSVCGSADLDGDGRGDLVVYAFEPREPGQPRMGVVYLISGASGQALRRLPYAGAVASVPDVDGDGCPDVVIGNGSVANGAGMVWVVSGANGGLLYTLQSPSAPTVLSSFGRAITGLADIDGDGRGDILVGAPHESRDGFNVGPGAAYLYSGGTGRLLRRFDSLAPQKGGGFGGSFGQAVVVVPDCSGDGAPEVLITAPYEQAAGTRGRAYLFLSCAATGTIPARLIPRTSSTS